MNEFLFVEFLVDAAHEHQLISALNDLPEGDFAYLNQDTEWDLDTNRYDIYTRVTGKIRAETATALTLGNCILSRSMRTSHISDELKNRYRNR